MIAVNKLKGKMVEKQISMDALAKALGLNRSTLYRRLGNADKYLTIREAKVIKATLGLSDDEATSIFFAR